MSLKSISSLTLLRLVGALAAVVYSLAQVQCFGTSTEIEIYFAGTAVFMMLMSMTQSGQLSEVLLPEYLRLKETHDRQTAQNAFSVVVNWMMIVVAVASMLAILFASPLIQLCFPGFDTEAQRNTVIVFRITCLYLNIEIAGAFIKTILHAESVYGRPETVGILVSVLGTIILLLTASQLGVWALVLVFGIGKLLTFAYYFLAIRALGFRFSARLSTDNFDHKKFFKTTTATVGYALATQFYTVVLNIVLSLMPQGIFAVFRYTQNLHARIRGTFAQPLLTVFFTNFAKQFHSETETSSKTVGSAIAYNFAMMGVIWILVAQFGQVALDVLWGSEKFAAGDLQIAYEIVKFNTAGLVVLAFGMVYRKVAVSIGVAERAYWYWALCQLLMAAVTWGLTKLLGIGGLKYILLTHASLVTLIFWWLVYRTESRLALAVDWRGLARTILSLVGTAGLCFAIYHVADRMNWMSISRFYDFGLLCIAAVVVAVGYTITATALGVPGMSDLVDAFSRRLRRAA